MDTSDDKNASAPALAEPRKSDASGPSREREARLAAALRANLRRRKTAPGGNP
jgi:hypothetical protein